MVGKALMVADVVDLVSMGRIGHADAMARLGLETYADLVETVHMHGKAVWAHRRIRPDEATKSLLARACGLAPPATGVSDDAERRG